jgi:hypothetical protein
MPALVITCNVILQKHLPLFARFFLVQQTQKENIIPTQQKIPNCQKYTKMTIMTIKYQIAKNIPNYRKIHLIFLPKAFQNIPKLSFCGVKTCHLATLRSPPIPTAWTLFLSIRIYR